jgi:SAM-dependent methyltransferase
VANPQADMVCAPSLRWRSWSEPGADDEPTRLAYPPGSVVQPPRMLTAYLADGGSTVPMCAVLVRRELLLACGGGEVAFRGLYEDAALLSKLHLRATAVLIGDVTSRYRQHIDSACAKAAVEGEYRVALPSPSQRRYLEWLDDYVQHVGCTDQRLLAAIERARAPYGAAWLFPLQHRCRVTLDRVRPRVPAGLRRVVRTVRGAVSGTGVGHVRFGSLRRLQPVSRDFGFSRGLPIDRYYIDRFLAEHGDDVRGRVLEIGDDSYTRRFGGERVTAADVLHVHGGNPRATFVGDLADGAGLPSGAFDCIILTQTLQFIYDLPAAVSTLFRVLRPGGVLLVTVPGISQIGADEWRHQWHWSLTASSAQRLFEERFGTEGVQVGTYGNVLTSASFLYGLTAGELKPAELDHHDSDYPMLVTVRAVRSAADAPES